MATSASLMVPGPWSREAASRYRGEDIGVHLTLNAEYDLYRWGPITHAPSLLDGDGGVPRTADDDWDHAHVDEVRREGRAQIERAIYSGFDVIHLDSHKGSLQLRPQCFDVGRGAAGDGAPPRGARGLADRPAPPPGGPPRRPGRPAPGRARRTAAAGRRGGCVEPGPGGSGGRPRRPSPPRGPATTGRCGPT